MHVDNPTPALVRQTPVWYVIFDVLYAAQRSTIKLPSSIGTNCSIA